MGAPSTGGLKSSNQTTNVSGAPRQTVLEHGKKRARNSRAWLMFDAGGELFKYECYRTVPSRPNGFYLPRLAA